MRVEVFVLGVSVPATGAVRALAKEDAVGAVSGGRETLVLLTVTVGEFIRRPEAAVEEVALVTGDGEVVFGVTLGVSRFEVFGCEDVLTIDPPVC